MSPRVEANLDLPPFKRSDASLFEVFEGEIFDNFNPEKLKILFIIGADVNEVEQEFGMNFLQKCIVEEFSLHESEGEIFREIIDLLISEGIDLNHQDIDRFTALHLAIEFQQFDLAKLLIEKGAITSIVDSEGKTASDYLKQIDPGSLTELANKHREELLELLT